MEKLGGLKRFKELHEKTLKSFARDRSEAHDENWSVSRESGGNGNVFELIERIDNEPEQLRPTSPMEVWRAARESHTADEFPYLLGDSILKKLYIQSVNWEPQGLKFCGVDETSKLEVDSPRPMISQLENLVEIKSGEERPLGQIGEARISVSTSVNARAWRVDPKTIINDDTGSLRDLIQPIMIASMRSLDVAIASKLETPGNAYDSVAFYHASAWPTGHTNKLTTALTANSTGGNVTLPAARLLMRQQSDVGPTGLGSGAQNLGLIPRFLVTGLELEDTASLLTGNSTVPLDDGSGITANRSFGFGLQTVGFIQLTDANDWYLFPDPSESPVHAFRVVFLNGRTLPTIRSGWATGGVAFDSNRYVDDAGLPLYPLHIEVNFPFKVNAFDPRGVVANVVAGGS